jgi:hypothetical protein
MNNILIKIRQKRNRFNNKLKQKLGDLSPTAKLNGILLVMLFYAVMTLIMLVRAFDKNDSAIIIKHIEPVPLIDAPIKLVPEKDTLSAEKFK